MTITESTAIFSNAPNPITTTPAERRDPNEINLALYRGHIIHCPVCLHTAESLRLSGAACRVCLGHGYVAECTNCDHTGKCSGAAVWDAGQTPYISTCNPCGGSGYYPVRKPADWTE